ncbi:MAG: sigma-54 dependent transcriptional regulator [Candidatus Eisenbacteria bacterium]
MTPRRPPSLLLIDDDEGTSGLLRELFHGDGYEVAVAATGTEGLRLAAERPYDAILCDVLLPDIDGVEVLRRLRRIDPDTPVIIMTAFGTVEMAMRALDEGAFDYVRKPFAIEAVRTCVARAVERRRQAPIPAALAAEAAPGVRAILGSHPAMVDLYKLVFRVAGTKSPVLIEGESGTGKELLARTIHEHSPRRGRPFVAVNCTSLAETLLESELFGHVRGAFTGAVERRPGLFLEANRGTIFLDEVGDMSLAMQAKLLRVLQEQEVKPVGGGETIPVDVRIVAATHRDLSALVSSGRFREDLYYRLRVVVLRVPPLRERREDIPLLAEHFLRRFAALSQRRLQGFSPGAMNALLAYRWPGNVRELENVVDRAVALAPGSLVGVGDIPEEIVATSSPGAIVMTGESLPLDEVVRRHVLAVLRVAGGNKSRAAKLLGVPRRSLYRMLERFGSEGNGRANVAH